MMAVKMGWSRYGDPDYVDHIIRYLKSSNHDVKLVNGSIDGFEIVMTEALKYEGQSYVWGGSHPSVGFDCSGLTQWSYKQAGIHLPRTAQEQYYALKRIDEQDAKPGDLVFFTGHMQVNILPMLGYMWVMAGCLTLMVVEFNTLILHLVTGENIWFHSGELLIKE
ncbi:Probable endopeptidase p60 precursor [Acinetobacter baumannii]|nr:Probable endopeptidase p60 precursor [Acinetobacter baumannii]